MPSAILVSPTPASLLGASAPKAPNRPRPRATSPSLRARTSASRTCPLLAIGTPKMLAPGPRPFSLEVPCVFTVWITGQNPTSWRRVFSLVLVFVFLEPCIHFWFLRRKQSVYVSWVQGPSVIFLFILLSCFALGFGAVLAASWRCLMIIM